VTHQWRTGVATGGRALAFLVAIAFVLYVVYTPNTTTLLGAGDVWLYRDYAQKALADPPELPREYPPLSTALFVVPQLLSPDRYMLGWTLWAAFAMWLVVLAVDWLSGRGWWLLLLLTLGAWGTAAFRFDIFVVLVTVLAFAAASRRRWVLAQCLLALAVALKLYPIILMPLVVVWQWRETRRLPISAALGGAGGLLAAIGSMWLVDPAQLAGLLAYHGQRPLEIESLGASLAWLRGPQSSITVDFSFGSFNLLTPSDGVLIPALSVATVMLLLLLYGWYAVGRIGPASAWALTLLISIATSKVFSTQYLIWPLPFVVLAAMEFNGSRRWAIGHWTVWVLIAFCTGLVYPLGFYWSYAIFETGRMPVWLISLITIRNVLWLLACVVLLRAHVRRHDAVQHDDSLTQQSSRPRSSLSA
jgi:hypothetical protein